MGVFRAALLLMLLTGAACFAAYAATGQQRFRRFGLRILSWSVLAGLAFFAVLIVLRLSESR
jgi:hypothetical protein